jgi:hypothetical protein
MNLHRKNGRDYLMGKTKYRRLLELVGDLGWDYERMSVSGQKTLDEIWKILDIEDGGADLPELTELHDK